MERRGFQLLDYTTFLKGLNWYCSTQNFSTTELLKYSFSFINFIKMTSTSEGRSGDGLAVILRARLSS